MNERTGGKLHAGLLAVGPWRADHIGGACRNEATERRKVDSRGLVAGEPIKRNRLGEFGTELVPGRFADSAAGVADVLLMIELIQLARLLIRVA